MASAQAVQKICPQWAAAGTFLLMKELDTNEDNHFLAQIQQILPNLQNAALKSEIGIILPNAKGMSTSDYLLYYQSIENIITALVAPSSFPTIFDLCLSGLYDSLSFCCQLVDPSRSYFKERTLFQPEITFPPNFFPHIERSLSFLYKIIEDQKSTDFSKIRSQIHVILNDFLLHPFPDEYVGKFKRYEGKIYSCLSADPNWFTVILSRIKNLLAAMKQKESKRVLVLLLQNLKYLRDATSETINELIGLSTKLSSDEVYNSLIFFIASTMINSQAMEAPGKFVSAVSKLSPTKKLDYQLMKSVIRLFSLDNSKDRHKKLSKLLKAYQKTGLPNLERLASLSVRLLCPNKFPVDLFIKEMNTLFFKKGKVPVLSASRASDVSAVVDVYVAAAMKDAFPVIAYLKSIISSFPQMKDGVPTQTFVLKTVEKIQKINDNATDQLIQVLGPYVQMFFSKESDPIILQAALSCLSAFWKFFPKSHTEMPELISSAAKSENVDVSLACTKGYSDLMKSTSIFSLPKDLTLTIPKGLAGRIDHTISQEVFIAIINQLSDYFETILNCSVGQKISQIDPVLLVIDTAMFPYLFYTTKSIHMALNHLYSILVKLTQTYFLGTYFLEHKGTSLRLCFSKNEDWFVGIYAKAAEFWVCMDRFVNQNFTNMFLKELFVICRAEYQGRKIEITMLFLATALEYMYKWKKDVIVSYLQLLHPSVWQAVFAEYEKLYKKYNGQPWHNFLFIQTAFVNNRFFSSYNGPTAIFDETLFNYISTKRSRFEKDVPYEILVLNVCSSYVRRKPDSLVQLNNKNNSVINDVLSKVNTKELFVINEPYIFAFLDFVAAMLKCLKIRSTVQIKEVIEYVIVIAEKSPEYSEIQYAVNECLSAMFQMNEESRSLIITSALSSRRSATMGWAILRSGIQLSRLELTELFVLAMSIFQTEPTLGINVAKMLVGGKLLINPLSEYDIETESMIWKTIEQNLSDEEILVYTQLLAESINGVRRRQKVSLFFTPFLEQNATINDFETVFSVISSIYEEKLALLPLTNTLNRIFKMNPQHVPQLFEIMYRDDANFESAAFVAQIAFKACPNEVSQFLLSKLNCFSVGNDALWGMFEGYSQKAIIASLSMILALVDNSIKYFEPILAQLAIFSLYTFEKSKGHSKHVPPLLFSLMHQMDLSIESFNGFALNSLQCEKFYRILRKYSPQICDLFDGLLIPKKLPSHCFSFVQAIAPLISPKSMRPLIDLALNYAQSDNVNNFLSFVSIILVKLNYILDPNGTIMFLKFILSFIYYNGDPRLIKTISIWLPSLIANKCPTQSLDANVTLTTALSTLLLVENLQSPLYLSTASFLKSLGQISQSRCVFTAYEILQALWALSGFKIEQFNNVTELVEHANKSIDKNAKKEILRFLLRFTSSNVVQDFDFRWNIANFVIDFVGNDYALLCEMKGIGFFILLSTICNDQTISSKYSKLLAHVVSNQNDVQQSAYNVLGVFGPTMSLQDPDTNAELVMIAPEYQLPPPELVPEEMQVFVDYFKNH